MWRAWKWTVEATVEKKECANATRERGAGAVIISGR
jgi:hypothetical protein